MLILKTCENAITAAAFQSNQPLPDGLTDPWKSTRTISLNESFHHCKFSLMSHEKRSCLAAVLMQEFERNKTKHPELISSLAMSLSLSSRTDIY